MGHEKLQMEKAMADTPLPKSTPPGRLLRTVSDRLRRALRKLRIIFDVDVECRVGDLVIALPADHLLPTYKKDHKLYDRFLPHLSKFLEPGTTVIDVGANCGDTLASMWVASKSLAYVCIEPDDVFFEYLEKNVLRIREADHAASIRTIKALLGKKVTKVSLAGSGGTKRAVVRAGKNSIASRSLDEVLSGDGRARTSLLKSDVDGYDYDVIDSAEAVIHADLPLLYFECQLDSEVQKAGYERTIAHLASVGYRGWVVFDNYGEVIVRTGDTDQIIQLMAYLWRQNIGRSTRTVHYYDVLGFTDKDRAMVDKVMASYTARA
jgi:FkbM family methyltransferase